MTTTITLPVAVTKDLLTGAEWSPADARDLLQRTAEINQRLVQAGVAVTELHADERSLEDVFMELTGTEGGL